MIHIICWNFAKGHLKSISLRKSWFLTPPPFHYKNCISHTEQNSLELLANFHALVNNVYLTERKHWKGYIPMQWLAKICFEFPKKNFLHDFPMDEESIVYVLHERSFERRRCLKLALICEKPEDEM